MSSSLINLLIISYYISFDINFILYTQLLLVLSIYVDIPNILKIKSNILNLNLNPGLYDFPFKIKIKETFQPLFEYHQISKDPFLH